MCFLMLCLNDCFGILLVDSFSQTLLSQCRGILFRAILPMSPLGAEDAHSLLLKFKTLMEHADAPNCCCVALVAHSI